VLVKEGKIDMGDWDSRQQDKIQYVMGVLL